LSNVVRLPELIPCRGNVGMWQLPSDIAAKVSAADEFLRMRIETAEDAYLLFRAAIPIAKDYEGFFVLPIDEERRPICKPVLVSLGHTRGTTAVELGEVFRTAFKAQADAIIVAHNHPSGDPKPSKADLHFTSTLQSAAQLLGIKFLDHLILGATDCEEGRGFVSVVERSGGL
jgi:DNA repair protein RadC